MKINGKETKKVEEELKKPLLTENEKQHMAAVKTRLQDVLGLNFDLITNLQILENGFVVSATITLKSDDGTIVSKRKSISMGADLESAKDNAFLEAAFLFGIPRFQTVNTTNCVSENNGSLQKEGQKNQPGFELISVEIASDWSKLKSGQIYCGVWSNAVDKKNGTKSVLVLGGTAQKKIAQAGYDISKILEAYTPGTNFCCFAEIHRSDGIIEYTMQDIHENEKKGE